MGGCGCGKSATPPSGMEAARQRRQEATDRAAAAAKARQSNPVQHRMGPAPVTGSFTAEGATQSFGSALERDAWVARNG